MALTPLSSSEPDESARDNARMVISQGVLVSPMCIGLKSNSFMFKRLFI